MHLMAKVITHQQQTYNCTRYSKLCEPHFLGHSVHRCCKLVMPSLADMVASHNQHGVTDYTFIILHVHLLYTIISLSSNCESFLIISEKCQTENGIN